MNKDLTVGDPGKVIRQFCIPLFASVIFQQLYNIADSLVAGKFAGENALAAVGNSYEITLIFIAFAFGVNIGCSVIVSRFFGSKDYEKMKTSVYTTLISGGVLCLILMAFGLGLGGKLLHLINTPDEVMADSKLYLDIYVFGLPFMFFYNIATGIFSALGDSKTPFIFLAFSSVANILMDILFVAAFHMGVAGVAWATFICQGVSAILSIIVVFRRLIKIKTKGKVEIFSWSILAKITAIAVPSILQQSFVSVGNIIIQGVINSFGTAVMAGYSASVKLNNLVITSMTTFANGVSNFTSQNIGAEKFKRVSEGYKASIKLVLALCVPIVLIYFIFGKYLIYLFLDNDTGKAMDTAMLFLRIVSPFYFIISIKLVTDGVLRGAGEMLKFMIATLTDLCLRVILALILVKEFEVVGIFTAWPVGWLIAASMSVLFYKKDKWSTRTTL